MQSPQLRLVVALLGAVTTLGLLSATPHRGASLPGVVAAADQEPKDLALKAWQDHLQSIGWSKQMSEQYAPRFLGVQKERVANEHGGFTVTFDGSRPGVRALATLVLDASGKLVGKPVVQLADVLEER